MHDNPLTLGVDIGTTGCRTALVSSARELVAASSTTYQPDRPRAGWAEQDPIIWWNALRETVQSVLRRAGTRNLGAISLSCQSTALIALDESFTPVRKAIIWQDTRCVPQCERISRMYGTQHVRRILGWPLHPFLTWPRILWMMENEPDLLGRTRCLVGVNGYIRQRLCGEMVLDRSNAIGLPRNIRTMSWDPQMSTWRDFPSHKVPRLVHCSSVVGTLSHRAANLCGLPVGLPVVAGGLDTACAAIAVGAYRPERTFEVSGTSGGVGVISQSPSEEPALGVASHVLPGLFINLAPLSAGGASLSWSLEELCLEEQLRAKDQGVSPYALIEEEVSATEDGPTGLLFLPYMAGERAPVWDPEARGAMLGLSLSTSRAQFLKGIMEGVGYALRHNITLAQENELSGEEIRSCGGGSRSKSWSQIKSDIVDRPLVVFRPERDAAFGAALLAGLGIDAWTLEDIEQGLDQEDPEIYLPREEITENYRRFQTAYQQAYPHLKELLPATLEAREE